MKFLAIFLIAASALLSLNKDAAYQVLASDDQEALEALIEGLEKENTNDFERAFLATALMKKADLLKKPKDKLQTFKKGALMLEELIALNPDNIEFRFLRLMIQENAPKITKYNTNIEEDLQAISSQFSDLEKVLQKHILAYAEQSEILKSDKLKE